MKYNKPHTKLKYSLGLVMVALTIGLMYFATTYIPKAYYFNWAVLAVALLTCLTPFGQKKLAARKDEKPRHSFTAWVLHIFALEVSLFAVFLGITQVCSRTLPALTHTHPSTAFQTNHFFFIHLGLFPWAIFALYAVSLGYLSYCKNKEASMSQLLEPLFHHKPAGILDVSLNVQARLATIAAVSATFTFVTLIILSLINPPRIPFLSGFHVKTMIVVMAVILFGFTPVFRNIVKKYLLDRKIPLYISLTSVLAFLAVLIVILNSLFYKIGDTTIRVPLIIHWMQERGWMNLWLIFAITWWICWTPIIAAHIARLSRGYTIRSTIIVTLILPVIFAVLLLVCPTAMAKFLNHNAVLMALIAIAGFMYILWRITEKSVLPKLIRSHLPKRDEYKRRDHYFFFRKVFQVTLIMLYLYLPAGLTVLSIFMFFLAFAFTVQILLNIIASILRLKTS